MKESSEPVPQPRLCQQDTWHISRAYSVGHNRGLSSNNRLETILLSGLVTGHGQCPAASLVAIVTGCGQLFHVTMVTS